MPQTPNHGYNVPNEGDADWHEPLNDNFENYDTDIEVRDTDGNRGSYTPKAGAKFLATDTENVYVGDGSSWNRLDSTGRSPSFESIDSTGSFLGVGRSSRITSQERFGVSTGATGTSYGGMYLDTDSSDARPFYGYDAGGTRMWHYYDGNTGSWHLYNTGDVLTVRNTGSVGVGLTTPSQPLEVEGTPSRREGAVTGRTDEPLGAGVHGHNTNTSKSTFGVKGTVETTDTAAAAVKGVVDASSGGAVALRGDAQDANQLALFTFGDAEIRGDLDVSGSKNFVETVETDDGVREVVYTAPEDGTPRTEASGVGQLEDGQAVVDLPEHFAWVTSEDEPLVVQLTPYGEGGGLRVVERSRHRIVVADGDGAGEYEFAYTVKGTRAGFEDKEVVREPIDRGPSEAERRRDEAERRRDEADGDTNEADGDTNEADGDTVEGGAND